MTDASSRTHSRIRSWHIFSGTSCYTESSGTYRSCMKRGGQLDATDCHIVTSVRYIILINRMALYDSCASYSQHTGEWVFVSRPCMKSDYSEWKVGEKKAHGANDCDFRMSNWSVLPGEVEVKLKNLGWDLQSIQMEKLEWIDTSLNCLLLLIMVRGHFCWWWVSTAFSYCYWKL